MQRLKRGQQQLLLSFCRRHLTSIDCPIGTTHSLTSAMSTQEWRRWNCDEAPWRRCHWFSRCGPVRYASTRGPELAAERPRAPPVCPKEAQGARNQYLPIAALEIWNLKVPKSFGIRTVFEMLVARFPFGIFACDDCRMAQTTSSAGMYEYLLGRL